VQNIELQKFRQGRLLHESKFYPRTLFGSNSRLLLSALESSNGINDYVNLPEGKEHHQALSLLSRIKTPSLFYMRTHRYRIEKKFVGTMRNASQKPITPSRILEMCGISMSGIEIF